MNIWHDRDRFELQQVVYGNLHNISIHYNDSDVFSYLNVLCNVVKFCVTLLVLGSMTTVDSRA